MNFGSDNQSGASEKVMQALVEANAGSMGSYGADEYTIKAEQLLRDVFECDLKAFFVSSGTAANCLALSSIVSPHQQILCHEHAHILNDELSAPEFFTGGARMRGFDLDAPKLRAESLETYLTNFEGHTPHTANPGALSLTQLAETGVAYSLEELRGLTDLAHEYGLKVHMDGARFTNALLGLGCSAADMSWKSGIDVLCLGASKNGALAAESIIFFNTELADGFEYRRKRAGHLLSKGRLLGAQFCAWLEDDHWLQLAEGSNKHAAKLARGLECSQHASLVWPVDGNELFVKISNERISKLRAQGAVFYEWPERFLGLQHGRRENSTLVRMVTSFITTEAEVNEFLSLLG
jgi:threonine aldolase